MHPLTATLLGVLLVIVLVKGVTYLLRWYELTGAPDFPDPAPAARLRRLGAGVPPFLRECLATVVTAAVWCVEVPLRPLLRRRPGADRPRPAPPDRTPVILVHGFSLTPWSLWFLWLALRLRGVGPLYLLDYHPMYGPIEGFAAQLAALVDRVARDGSGDDGDAEPPRTVDVVAHSMGGLVAARYMVDHPGRVRRLVAIGTPFHGTRLWAMSVGRSLPQMRPGSPFLTETVVRSGFPGAAALTSIHSPFDQIILPHTASRVERDGVRNVEVGGLGHNALLLSPRVAREVLAAITAPTPP
jgi:pimeloyl-ACP methyl ester carboxylesterase